MADAVEGRLMLLESRASTVAALEKLHELTLAGLSPEEAIDDKGRCLLGRLTRRLELIDEGLALWDRTDEASRLRSREGALELAEGWMEDAGMPRKERTSLRRRILVALRTWCGL